MDSLAHVDFEAAPWRCPPLRVLTVAVLSLAPWVAAAGLAGCLLLEGSLRMAGLPNGGTRSVRNAYDLDGATVGPFRAGSVARIVWPPETAHVARFNRLGCRGPEPRQTDRSPILCVGDSMTYGLGVEDDQTWPAHLDKILDAVGTGRAVVNLSSAHLVIEDELKYLAAALPVVRPGIVVLLVPSTGYIDPIDTMSRTPHETSRRRERRRRPWPSNWYHASATYEARTLARLWRKRQAMTASKAFPPDFETSTHAPVPDYVVRLRPRYRTQVAAFRRLVVASGARFVLAAFPTVRVRDGRATFRPPWTATLGQAEQTLYVDVTDAFRHDAGGSALLLLPHDLHASSRGNRVLAQQVANVLQASGALQ